MAIAQAQHIGFAVLLLIYCVYGIGYITSILMDATNANISAVIIGIPQQRSAEVT
jgi:predicted Na+-dependent transporter